MTHAFEPTPCKITDVLPDFKVEQLSESDQIKVEEYFAQFAAPVLVDHQGSKDLVCFNCGGDLFGVRSSIFGAGGYNETRNIGNGRCRVCAWPARSHHLVIARGDQAVLTIGSRVLMFLENPDVPTLDDITDELHVPEIVEGQQSR